MTNQTDDANSPSPSSSLVDLASSSSIEVRARLAERELLPAEIELLLASDSSEYVKATFLMMSTSRSRAAIQVMEDAEVNSNLRDLVSRQDAASASSKRSLPLSELAETSLMQLADDLGFTAGQTLRLRETWIGEVRDSTEMTVGEALDAMPERTSRGSDASFPH